MFQPNGDLVDLVLQSYFNDIGHNQDDFVQQENEEVFDQMNSLLWIK